MAARTRLRGPRPGGGLDGRPVLGPLDLTDPARRVPGHAGPERIGQDHPAARPDRGGQAHGRRDAALRQADLPRTGPRSWPGWWAWSPNSSASTSASLSGRWWPWAAMPIGGHAEAAEAATRRGGGGRWPPTGLSDLADRPVTQLSGGERQRALIAQTLAQETPVLLLDEPLNNLDLNHQLEIMQLLGRLHASGRTIVVVLHDLNIAAQYCERLVLLDKGRIAAEGTADEILDPAVILEVFRVRVAVHRQGARPYITPLWTKTHDAATRDRGAERARHGRRRRGVRAAGGVGAPRVHPERRRGQRVRHRLHHRRSATSSTCSRRPPFQPFPAEAVAADGGVSSRGATRWWWPRCSSARGTWSC